MSIRFLALTLTLLGPPTVASERTLPRNLNEEVVMLPIGGGLFGTSLETTLFRPPGPGPFPLVVINHGKESGNPKFQPRARYLAASREFVRRGYLVALPMRSGFANSGGGYVEAGCNIASNAKLQEEEIRGIVAALSQRPDIDATRILLVGQSHGGLSVMATASSRLPGVRGILNFAGGYRYTGQYCTWERSLVDAFADLGKGAETPSIWFYGDNDSYWGKALPAKMFEAFTTAGGKAQLVAYGEFAGGDAHSMFASQQGVAIWWPPTERFLKDIGLPGEIRYTLASIPRPPKTDFADQKDIRALPYLDDKRREMYRKFLEFPSPRAFAIAKTGNVGWAHSGNDSMDRALENCERQAKTNCTLYAVDHDVVWPKPE